ncbi:hypothetical protein [Nocardia brasiliensis]|uniref:hypothetical protein n=1 Tax=Nocardia brasiliensis TaxID=37326 RepID=UPI002457EE45|nr:hypothetical protein [Nocardia brasiliensis]
MTTATILTSIASTILIIQAATRIPPALTELLRACQPLILTARDLTTKGQQSNRRHDAPRRANRRNRSR